MDAIETKIFLEAVNRSRRGLIMINQIQLAKLKHQFNIRNKYYGKDNNSKSKITQTTTYIN